MALLRCLSFPQDLSPPLRGEAAHNLAARSCESHRNPGATCAAGDWCHSWTHAGCSDPIPRRGWRRSYKSPLLSHAPRGQRGVAALVPRVRSNKPPYSSTSIALTTVSTFARSDAWVNPPRKKSRHVDEVAMAINLTFCFASIYY